MKLEELALLMGKSKQQLIDELNNNEMVELKLVEKNDGMAKDNFKIELLN